MTHPDTFKRKSYFFKSTLIRDLVRLTPEFRGEKKHLKNRYVAFLEINPEQMIRMVTGVLKGQFT